MSFGACLRSLHRRINVRVLQGDRPVEPRGANRVQSAGRVLLGSALRKQKVDSLISLYFKLSCQKVDHDSSVVNKAQTGSCCHGCNFVQNVALVTKLSPKR